jgi:TatA/E family protein of Tat protein translocase
MLGPLGLPELLFILVLVLLIFGPKRLPEIGRTIGRGLGELRRASDELKRTLSTELALDEEPRPGARRPGQAAVRPAAAGQARALTPAPAAAEASLAGFPEAVARLSPAAAPAASEPAAPAPGSAAAAQPAAPAPAAAVEAAPSAPDSGSAETP